MNHGPKTNEKEECESDPKKLNEFKEILSAQTPEERAAGPWMSKNMKGFG